MIPKIIKNYIFLAIFHWKGLGMTKMKEQAKLFLADASDEFRAICKEQLTRRGFAIAGETGDGSKAVDLIERTKPAIVLIDLWLPQLDGISVMKEIKRRKLIPSPAFFVVTGIQHSGMFSKAIALGARSCLSKPIDFATLAAELDHTISQVILDTEQITAPTKQAADSSAGKDSIAALVAELLRAQGYETDSKGYRYQKAALLMEMFAKI